MAIFALDVPFWVGIILGVSLVAVGTCGDLIESMIKRDLGIKDMSSFLPGHGGVMDRLDSLLVAAPVAWLIMYVFVPGG
jgi:phosphatidate cytidylyltransferase